MTQGSLNYAKNTLYQLASGISNTIYLRRLSPSKAQEVLIEVHWRECGGHQAVPKMRHIIKLLGHYWPCDLVLFGLCQQICHKHGNILHRPPRELHPTMELPDADEKQLKAQKKSQILLSSYSKSLRQKSSYSLIQEGWLSLGNYQRIHGAGARKNTWPKMEWTIHNWANIW